MYKNKGNMYSSYMQYVYFTHGTGEGFCKGTGFVVSQGGISNYREGSLVLESSGCSRMEKENIVLLYHHTGTVR